MSCGSRFGENYRNSIHKRGAFLHILALLANQALAENWAKKRLHQTRYNPTGIESLDHWHSTEPEVHQTENLDDLTISLGESSG